MSKIHWSAMSDELRFACETDCRKCGHNAKHRSDLTACQYLAKHGQSPDLYCKRCARVAAFSAAEVEHLRALAEYLSRQFIGIEARKGLDVLKGKVGP